MKTEKSVLAHVNDDFKFALTPEELNSLIVEFDVRTEMGIIRSNGSNHHLQMMRSNHADRTYDIRIDGYDFSIRLERPLDQMIATLGFNKPVVHNEGEIKAPMPGQVVDCQVKEGDVISDGTPLITLEAMKMENVVQSHIDGKVESVLVSKGDAVTKGQVIIKLVQ